MRDSSGKLLAASACVVLASSWHGAALAQFAHHPFAVGANEGAVGHQNAMGAWLLGQESRFYLSLTQAVRAARTSIAGALTLVGLSFGYGVFHAAGPGHGKAVITSYMVSNEIALRRGILISLLAALLQGAVATGLVGLAALVFHATAQRMTAAAATVELMSYGCIVALGLVLCWRKGWLLLAAVSPEPLAAPFALAAAGASGSAAPFGFRKGGSDGFKADDGLPFHPDDCGCGHPHMPDPRHLGGRHVDLRAAALAVVTAGARPCSGAILVLVFAMAQGIFVAGVAATFAMALGTAVTTGALATAAVHAKALAVRLSGSGSQRAAVVGRAVEFLAAACVLLFGLALLAAWFGGVHSAA